MSPPQSKTRLGALLAGLVALLALLAIWSGGCRSLLESWFGPPEVELSEAFEGVEGDAVFDHSTFDALLRAHVDGAGYVDYAGLAERQDELDAYLASLASAPIDDLGRDERLALLINAYNAFTLRLILDHYPIASIRDIPADERWQAVRWSLAGTEYSLDQIEHELVRPNFREPRIHFALVCAAIGCPPLRAEAFTGERLESQLEEQTIYSHSHDRWMRYEPGADVVWLTSLYQWYGGDFEQVAGSILAFAARYDENLASDLAAGHEPEVRFLDYDWSLNER